MKFLARHPTFLCADDIREICRPLKTLGIEYFGHAMIDENERLSAICTHPEFFKHYFKKKYYNVDIHQTKIPCGVNYVSWDMMQPGSKLTEFYSDFNSFALGHSFTIIHYEKNIKHYYHFSGSLDNAAINEVYLRNYDFLKRFILYYTEQINAHRELKLSYNIKISLENDKNNLSCIKPAMSLPINRTYISHHQYLTSREMECLHWLSQGKTIEEIAIILGITKRTMKAHVTHMKAKLNCSNLFQLGLAAAKMK